MSTHSDMSVLSTEFLASLSINQQAIASAATESLLKAQPDLDSMANKVSSSSDLSDYLEDAGPDPFESTITKTRNAAYRQDIEELKRLTTRYKEAHLTSSFVRQVETQAELELFLETIGKKWPTQALGLGMKKTLEDIEGQYPNRSLGPGGVWKDDTFSIADDADTSDDSLSGDDQLSSSIDDTENVICRDDFFCSYGAVYYCDRSFETEQEAIIHSTVHTASSGKYKCPHAGLYDCTKTFASLYGARKHGDAVHLKIKTKPCPHAKEYNCSMAFDDTSHANRHGLTHDGVEPRHPCPYATVHNCSKKFTRLEHAERHGMIHLKKEAKIFAKKGAKKRRKASKYEDATEDSDDGQDADDECDDDEDDN